MPTLEFKGKHHIYAHHLTVPYRPLETDETRSCNPTGEDDNFIIPRRQPARPEKHYYPATQTVSNVSTLTLHITPATRDGAITTTLTVH